MTSSSGGVFTLLGRAVLDSGGYVFGAALDDECDVVHQGVQDEEGLARLRGSKYVQSRMGDVYPRIKQLLEEGRTVLFSGTPCQVGGLRAFLGGECAGLVCVDLVCHGVPSPSVWRRYLRFLEERAGSKVTRVSFRDKSEGWRKFSLAAEFADGLGYRMTRTRDPFMRAFLSDICLRPSCYECRFKGLERVSDLTLADFWSIRQVAPEFDDHWGTSLVLLNSEAGRLAFARVMSLMDEREVTVEVAIQGNSAAVRSAQANPKSEAFYRDLNSIPFDRLIRRYCTPSLSRRVREAARRVIGRLQRLLCTSRSI